jgi:hypothetical protein
MSARETFQFAQKYTLRPAGTRLADFQLAESWTMADPDHRGRIHPSFWLEQGEGRDSFLFSDDIGPLFFFKMVLVDSDVAEIHIQFPPPESAALKEHRCRIAEGLIQGMEWLEKILSQIKMKEMRFDSTNPGLVRFTRKRLGFIQDGGILRKQLI